MLHVICLHFSLYDFAHDLLLAVYCIFILDYGNDVAQKAHLSNFSYWSSKQVGKQWRQLTSIHLAQEEALQRRREP